MPRRNSHCYNPPVSDSGCGLNEICSSAYGRTRWLDLHVCASQVQIRSGQLRKILLNRKGKQNVKIERERLTEVWFVPIRLVCANPFLQISAPNQLSYNPTLHNCRNCDSVSTFTGSATKLLLRCNHFMGLFAVPRVWAIFLSQQDH
jgi:hypothetical protein